MQSYLSLMRQIRDNGADQTDDRTGVGTRTLFGTDLGHIALSNERIPLLTTKKVAWKTALRELLWFLSGGTNIRPLLKQNVRIWTAWPLERYRHETGDTTISQKAFEARIVNDADFAARYGELGPVYGKQWVDWEAPDGRRINQIEQLIEDIKTKPSSRRLLFHAWNVADIPDMALPPCHLIYHYQVIKGKLNGVLYQRSVDVCLGLPFNLFSAATLLRMIAQQCELEPGTLKWFGGDTHIYSNHWHLVETQLTRTPRPLPGLRILRRPPTIFDYRVDDFEVVDYDHHPHIAAPIAV